MLSFYVAVLLHHAVPISSELFQASHLVTPWLIVWDNFVKTLCCKISFSGVSSVFSHSYLPQLKLLLPISGLPFFFAAWPLLLC